MYRQITVYFLVTAINIVGNAAHLEFVDLTHIFDENTLGYPITSNDPDQFKLTVRTIYPNGQKLTTEEYSGSTHAGTHINCPSHFYPGAASVDQLELDNFIGPAAVIDITCKADSNPDAEVTVEDLIEWESSTEQSLNGTIVFMRSGYSAKYSNKTAYFGTPEYDSGKLHFPGFSPDSAKWLVDNRLVKAAGVDTLSLDRGTSTEYQAHKYLFQKGIYVLENVANLENIPISGATVYAMPMYIAGGSAAPVRIIATFQRNCTAT